MKLKRKKINLKENVTLNTAKMVIINEYPLITKEHQEKRWVTYKDIDKIHNRPTGTASRNFKTNKKYFIEGEDYIIIKHSQKDEFRLLEIPNRGLTLFSETGYLMLVKSFTDDLAWKVQRELINTYFKYKNEKIEQQQYLPIEVCNILTTFSEKLNCIEEIKNKCNRLESLIAILLPQPKRSVWKYDMGSKIKVIAQTLGVSSNDTKKIYGDIYNIMREDYNHNINPYMTEYLLNHPELPSIPVIDVVEYYSELKELFEAIVSNYLEIKTKIN